MVDEEEDPTGDTCQAYTFDRTFRSKAGKVGIYSTGGDGDEIQYYGELPGIDTEAANSENMTLYNGEQNLLYIDPEDRQRIQCYDFEKAKIVETWEAASTLDLTSFCGINKNSQKTPDSLLYACTSKGIFTLDPRESGSKKSVQ